MHKYSGIFSKTSETWHIGSVSRKTYLLPIGYKIQRKTILHGWMNCAQCRNDKVGILFDNALIILINRDQITQMWSAFVQNAHCDINFHHFKKMRPDPCCTRRATNHQLILQTRCPSGVYQTTKFQHMIRVQVGNKNISNC